MVREWWGKGAGRGISSADRYLADDVCWGGGILEIEGRGEGVDGSGWDGGQREAASRGSRPAQKLGWRRGGKSGGDDRAREAMIDFVKMEGSGRSIPAIT